jgi:membrane-bound metal-dependent hydrolase YbcI (DUF457 family)
MPLPIAHGLVGASIIAALYPHRAARSSARPLLIGALVANAADGDFLLELVLGSGAWHRGFSHSLAFALVVYGGFLCFFGIRRSREALVYGLAYASHPVLDFVTTNAGRRIALLWPFSSRRLKLGWWGLSEMPLELAPGELVQALMVEVMLFAPVLCLVVLVKRVA